MPGADEISTRIALTGEREYRDKLKSISAAQGVLASETSKATAAFDKNDASVEALTVRNEQLSKKLDVQKQKVDTCRKALENAAKGFGEADARTVKWQKELNYAEAAVIRTERAIQQNTAAIEALGRAAEQAKVDGLTDQLKGVDAALGTAGIKLDGVRAKLEKRWDAGTFADAQQLAQEAIDKTQQKAELLRQKMALLEEMGTDRASAEYQELERELAQTEAAAEKARNQLKSISNIRLDQIKKVLAETSATLNSLGGKLTMGLTAPLVAGGVAATKYASDAAEAANKVEVAFGSAADGVKAWSDTTLTSIGLAKGTALDMAALYGDMATSMGFGRAEAAEMSKSLVNLSADMASFKNISIDIANTALKSIFTGETESLKSLGVVMTEANLKAYALAEGYAKSYESMSQTEKVTLRYQYILSQTKNAQGDFARTFDGTANQLRICRESLKELAATAGDELLPIVTPIIMQINELLQSFGEMDESTRKLIVQIALFLAALGPAMKLTGGLASGLDTVIPLLAKLKTSLAGATAAQTALNAAQTATPWGAIATGIGVVIAALGSFVLTSALTKERTEELSDSLEESREAYEKIKAELAEQRADTLGMVSALEELSGTEHKTAAQKEALLELVRQLNEAVPELNLAYDAQTDSLTNLETGAKLTTDAIRELALAEAERGERTAAVERLSKLYVEQAAIGDELAAAEDALAEAEARKNQMLEEGVYGMAGYESATREVNAAILSAKRALDTLGERQADNASEVAALEEQYRGHKAGLEDAAGALRKHAATAEEAAKAAAVTAGELRDLTATIETETKATQALVAETDTLAAAFAEQQKSGSLSLDTTLKLIDAGYAAALSIDQETGAVRLDTAAYREIAEAKLNEQITDLTGQRVRAESTLKMRAEAEAAAADAAAHLGLAKAKRVEAASGKDSIVSSTELEAQLKSLDAQIAALKALKGSLGKVASGSYGATGGSRGSSTGKSAAETEAERAVAAYRAAMEELDFLRDTDEVSEEAYYQRLGELRDKYLEEHSDEWRSATVKLHNWQKAQADAEAQAKADAYQEELADLKYFLDMDIISEEEYYRKLAELRDTYLEENSDAWRQANTALHAYLEQCRQEELDALKDALEAQKSAIEGWYKDQQAALKDRYEAQKDEARDAYDAEKAAAKDAYEARKAQIKDELAREKARLNAVLEGIDKEIQARRELREDQDQDAVIAKAQRRLEAAQAQREFARTDEDRRAWDNEILQLEQALQEAIQAKEDTEFYRQKEQEKEQVRDQIGAAEQAADAALAGAETAYQTKLAELESAYEARLVQLEADYQAGLKELEAEYRRRLKEAKDAYERSVREVEASYEQKEQQESGGSGLGKGSGGGGKHQRGVTAGDISTAGAAKQAASAMAGVMTAAAGAAARAVSQITKNSSASVTIHQAPALTEGQIANTVRKVLQTLDR